MNCRDSVIAILTRVDEGDEPPYNTCTNDSHDTIRSLPNEILISSGRHVLGRGKNADVVMSIRVNKKEIISRAHAEIVCSNNDIIFLKDLNSVNGVFVNGLRIDSQMLYDNDIIQIGGMAKMPTGKKLKQSADNVQYRFQYKDKVPQMLKYSAPSSADKSNVESHRGSSVQFEVIEDGRTDSHNKKVKDPFKRNKKLTNELDTADIKSSSASISELNINNVALGDVASLKKRSRSQSNEDEVNASPRVEEKEDTKKKKKTTEEMQENALVLAEEKCQHLQGLLDEAESEARRQETRAQQQDRKLQDELREKEESWLKKVHSVERELRESKVLLNEQLRAKDNLCEEMKEKSEKHTAEISALNKKMHQERSGYVLKLQAAHDEDLEKNNSEWEEKLSKMEKELEEVRHQNKQQQSVIVQHEEALKDTSARVSLLQSAHDKELLSKDEVWAEKMNALLKTSAEESQSFRTQIKKLRGNIAQDQDTIKSYQRQVTSLKTAAEAAAAQSIIATSVPSLSTGVAENSVCSIGVDALREYIMCALCQQPMLDAVVCRCSHGFCHACLEMYIHNENERIAREKSKYSIHKTLASLKAGNRTDADSQSQKRNNDIYANFACPVCQHEEDEHGSSNALARGMNQLENQNQMPFFRSENLDSIIYLCHQASSVEEREAFEQREATNFHVLKTLGIDPMAVGMNGSSTVNGSSDLRGNGNAYLEDNGILHAQNSNDASASNMKSIGLASNGKVTVAQQQPTVSKRAISAAVDSESDSDSVVYGDFNGDGGDGGSDYVGY